jgi:hypothetical protein
VFGAELRKSRTEAVFIRDTNLYRALDGLVNFRPELLQHETDDTDKARFQSALDPVSLRKGASQPDRAHPLPDRIPLAKDRVCYRGLSLP